MKLVTVTQWVPQGILWEVPPDQRLATRSVEKSAGKPGDRSPKPDGSRMQAVY
jgi:hypothetical protein